MAQEVGRFIEGVCFSAVVLAERFGLAHRDCDEVPVRIVLVGAEGGHVARGMQLPQNDLHSSCGKTTFAEYVRAIT